ncbi:hypothetical protein H5162_12140 [Pseudoalteromonas sp. SR41-8]|uniref:hypothetical protein n=1 Tax=Pseudoalteromonas sp. SR41-8 TaxID=2760946 RepID=UPI0016046D98|nr:hypothetical protein [Pseudoalteromonas sp. SR41-8]MBB1310172.1 hypothetical protein [Pseudoalteromonas sp. SR41-8]
MNQKNITHHNMGSAQIEKHEYRVSMNISRKNIVIRNGVGHFKRGPYKGATLSLSPEEITALYEVGKALVPIIISAGITYKSTKSGAKASRGTSKVCPFKKPLTKIACGKPLYYRERALNQNGKTIEIFTCDAGHECKQPIISAVK